MLEKVFHRHGNPALGDHFPVKPDQVVIDFKDLLNNAFNVLFRVCQLVFGQHGFVERNKLDPCFQDNLLIFFGKTFQGIPDIFFIIKA